MVGSIYVGPTPAQPLCTDNSHSHRVLAYDKCRHTGNDSDRPCLLLQEIMEPQQQLALALEYADLLRASMAGNLRSFQFEDCKGKVPPSSIQQSGLLGRTRNTTSASPRWCMARCHFVDFQGQEGTEVQVRAAHALS